ncbi:MAG: amidohydrolase [Candidatus Altiarchaeota archaeon]|nr:amidohydrolase [Candidatus Altiarchaeota archaeon]
MVGSGGLRKHLDGRNSTSLFMLAILALVLLLVLVFSVTKNLEQDSPSLSQTPSSEAEFYANKDFGIINVHEHIQSFKESKRFLEAMDIANVSVTILLGSPEATLFSGRTGFKEYDANNEEVLKIIREYPDRFMFLPTMYPGDPRKLEKLKDYMGRGGVGLKLYSGHTFFYENPLNESSMTPVYAYLEENDIPLLIHVNPGRPHIRAEFENLLDRFPDLTINCPHFCLSSIADDRLSYFLDKYPNLYSDVSFGFYAQDGLERISRNTTKFKEMLTKYQDRFMFGTDMVVTEHPRKTTEWIYNLTMCYRDMLEKEEYYCKVGTDFEGHFKGLALDASILRKIYYENPQRFFKGKL